MPVSVYEQVKRALQDIVAPELKALQVEIKRLDEKMDSVRAELLSEIRRLDTRIDSLERELSTRIDSLERELRTAIELRERISAIEAKLGL